MQEKQSQSQNIPTGPEHNSTAEKIQFLTHHDIFRRFNPDEIGTLEHITTAITYPPGRILYRPGETSSVLFLVKSGWVQLYHLSTDGRKLITATRTVGACFGEIPLSGQAAYTSFAETGLETQLYLLNKSDLEQLLLHKPAIVYGLLQTIAQHYLQLETQLIETTFKGTTARLALLLLALACPEGSSDQPQVVLGLSHEELADRLGVYRETVSGALRDLKEVGAITLGRKRITIRTPALLEEIATTNKKLKYYADESNL